MKTNQFNELIFDTQDIFDGLYSGKLKTLSQLNIENRSLIKQFNQYVEHNADNIDIIPEYIEPNCTIEEFDRKNQSQWFIPEEYKNFDIANWLLSQCKTEKETVRVVEELELFVQHNMIGVLICLKYLVDYMRTNKIVWGLGRGSSVASYCLYLIGVHKVDSIKYQLDIKEFLKGEIHD
jgi:DNA polymerase III alpha subunit